MAQLMIVQCPLCDKQMTVEDNQIGYQIMTNHIRHDHKERLIK